MNRIAYLITLLSMTGTLANSFGKRWCFYVWLGTNGFWCVYNASCEQYAQALLYAFNLVTCIVGLWKWRKVAAKKCAHTRPRANRRRKKRREEG